MLPREGEQCVARAATSAARHRRWISVRAGNVSRESGVVVIRTPRGDCIRWLQRCPGKGILGRTGRVLLLLADERSRTTLAVACLPFVQRANDSVSTALSDSRPRALLIARSDTPSGSWLTPRRDRSPSRDPP